MKPLFPTNCILPVTAILLCMMSPRGFAAGDIVQMAFSPDGRYLAATDRDGVLQIIDLQTREQRIVSREVAARGGLDWSPNSNRLVFCLRRNDAWDLALAGPDGEVTMLTKDLWRDFNPVWSPDGAGIYYCSSRGAGYHGDYDIRFYEIAGEQSYLLISGPHDQSGPRISPDGRWLAAISFKEGNPVLLVYAVKAMRALQISMPPQLRGGELEIVQWLADGERILCHLSSANRHCLMLCRVQDESWEMLIEEAEPLCSVCLNPRTHEVLFVAEGRARRLRIDGPAWARERALSLDDLPPGPLAVSSDGQSLAVAVAGALIGTANARGRHVTPVIDSAPESLRWGDLYVQSGRLHKGLGFYQRAAESFPADQPAAATAHWRLDRSALLCREGDWRLCRDFLDTARGPVESAADPALLDRFRLLHAVDEFVGFGNEAEALQWLDRIDPTRRGEVWAGKTNLLENVLRHPDRSIRSEVRGAIAQLWQGKGEEAFEMLGELLASQPHDPVIQQVYRQAVRDRFALPVGDVFQPPGDVEIGEKALAGMIVKYPEIAGEAFEMDREWFTALAGALLTLGDANMLGRLGLQYGRQFLSAAETIALYRRYWRLGFVDRPGDAAAEEVLAMVLFDPEILTETQNMIDSLQDRTDVHLARARWTLVGGDYEEMKIVLAAIEANLQRYGRDRVFGEGPDREIAYQLLRASYAERVGAWARAVVLYQEAAAKIESDLQNTADGRERKTLESLLVEARFRAELFQRGPAARAEAVDLLTVERGVGDRLMARSSDPRSLVTGIHNYFALLGRIGTPWVVDLVYLKTGQCYRLLGRWGEAAYCLRVAAASDQAFIARRANAELAILYRDLGDPGLAAWYERRM